MMRAAVMDLSTSLQDVELHLCRHIASPLSGQIQNPPHFLHIKGLCQYIISAQIQHLCPKIFVCQPAGHDDKRRSIRPLDGLQKVSPSSGDQISLADYDLGWAVSQKLQSLREALH
jgi:hypothetical protein